METELSLPLIMLHSTGFGTYVYSTASESTTLTTIELRMQKFTMYKFYCKSYTYLNNLNINYFDFNML
jgi:hypothetical protein